ncbi:excinuclease ABC subunit UvrC [Pseudahrensia aquimaris]|uniref:UvrABC system protein C n=1 Tax=Pseudahrensia aquimaris TaxID=744461 RepID=A0ABW3FCQ5_9HYPH
MWEEAAQLSDLRGAALIGDLVKRLPAKPGVYRMMNAAGDVLYVGKAKNLKNRVQNYARGIGHGGNRTARMIAETAAMDFITTHTETESLLLEANLIKRLRPRFNVLMRDDKSFPYILLSGDHEAPGLFKHRGARNRKGQYFGPFASAGAVNTTINALQRIFLLRTCTDSFYAARTRPCLLHQIKRCAGPCTGEISQEDYTALVKEAQGFLTGKSSTLKTAYSERMQKASDELDFETAALYRDRLASLSHVQAHQGINPQTVDEADIFAVHQEGGQFCIQVFFFRTGQNWGNRAYFPRADKSYEEAEVMAAFVSQFYDDKPVPKLVLVSHEIAEADLIAEALSLKAERKVQIYKPQRGEKRELVEMVARNAREALGRKLAEGATQTKLLEGIKETFGLERVPRRIEVYDNSHIMGTNAVGGMIVAGPEGFVKNQYRKFNIKDEDITPGDDYGMMREVFMRRFSRLLKEHGERGEDEHADKDAVGPWPDLVLIDGGAGQLSAVREVMKELGLSQEQVPLVGVAKGIDRDAGRERFFMPGKQPFSLPLRDPVLYFIQRMRDEAHRFAIGTHRSRRKKDMVKNPLDEIPGIGPGRKRAILHYFGSAKSAARAGVEDLKKVDGISEAMAQTIYDHFQKG